MNAAELIERASPVVEGLFEDEEVRRRIRGAVRAGRAARREAQRGRRASALALMRRIGVAVREAGDAAVALSRFPAEKRRREEQRRARARAAVLATLAGAAGVAWWMRSQSTEGHDPEGGT